MALRKPIEAHTLLANVGTTATTGTSGAITLRDFDFNNLIFQLTVPSISATALLDVWVQTTLDGGTTWLDMIKFKTFSASAANSDYASASLGSLSLMGTVGASTITSTAGGTGVPLLSPTLRAYWNLAGTTPSASFNLTSYETGIDRGMN